MLNSLMFSLIFIFVKGELKNDFLNNLELKLHDFQVTKITSDDIAGNSSAEMLNNNELKMGGIFYDIFKTEVVSGRTIYYCFSDENEKFLEKTLTKFLSYVLKGLNSKSSGSVKLIQLSGFLLSNFYSSIEPLCKVNKPKNICSLKEVVLRIPTPPPELIFS